jgi:hypothetical protein
MPEKWFGLIGVLVFACVLFVVGILAARRERARRKRLDEKRHANEKSLRAGRI